MLRILDLEVQLTRVECERIRAGLAGVIVGDAARGNSVFGDAAGASVLTSDDSRQRAGVIAGDAS